MKYTSFAYTWTLLLSISLVILLGACNSGGASSDAPTAVSSAPERAVPTMPAARFTAVSAQHALTETVAVTETAATATPSVNLELGARVYANRCESCHGPQGEGVDGQAGSIQGISMTFSEFDVLLRTGGQGSLGPTHLFGPSSISGSGMEALHAYVQTLAP